MIAGLWLALGIAAIAASAIAYTRHGDARNIIRLGASLAFVQIVDPMGGLIVAALLPGLFGLRRKEAAQSAGLYTLVLFMPAITALALAYLAHVRHIDVPRILLGVLPSPAPVAIAPVPLRLLASIVPLAMAVPALLRGVLDERGWKPPNVVIVLIAGAMCAAAIFATWMGTPRPASSLALAALPLPLIAIWQWPVSKTRLRDAAIVSTLTALLAWSLA
jgi:hypothetical protein